MLRSTSLKEKLWTRLTGNRVDISRVKRKLHRYTNHNILLNPSHQLLIQPLKIIRMMWLNVVALFYTLILLLVYNNRIDPRNHGLTDRLIDYRNTLVILL